MKPAKNKWVALALTFVILGLGQFYNGQWGKGFAALGLGLIFAILIGAGIGLILLPIWYVFVGVDAFNAATKLVKCRFCLSTIDGEVLVCPRCTRDLAA